MDADDDILDIALKSGMLILQSGGETYRAEETMVTIATSLGAASASAFVTPTVVMLTCVGADGESHTRIQRISERFINLGVIARINELSRRLQRRRGQYSLGAVEALLRRAESFPLHRPATVVLATAISSFCFSLLFLGSWREAACAFLIGAVMRLVLFLIGPLALSSFIVSVIGGFVISLLSASAAFVGILPSSGNVSIAVLMALVPGLAIVNAIRDIISGDLVAGGARLTEAFVIAAALSLGAAFGLMLFPADVGYVTALRTLNSPVGAFVLAFFATGAFAWFFYINRYDILAASLIGALGWLAYLLISSSFAGATMSYMFGALIVGLLSELFAAVFRKPATVYIVPGIIPLVPGGGMYETMLMAVWGKKELAATVGFNTLTAAAAIAVGIALASSLARLVMRLRSTRRAARRSTTNVSSIN